MPKRANLTGQRFGRLVAVECTGSLEKYGQRRHGWLWRCDCGKEFVDWASEMLRGRRQSCGCFKDELFVGVRVVGHQASIEAARNKRQCKQSRILANLLPETTRRIKNRVRGKKTVRLMDD